MTGRTNYTPEAEQQLHALDDWITEEVSWGSRSAPSRWWSCRR